MKPEALVPSSVSYVNWGEPVFVNPDPNRVEPANRAVEQAIKTELHRGEVALFAGQYACFASAEHPEITLEPRPELRLGREMSRYGVSFWTSIVSSEIVPQVRTTIAVKPYDKRVYNRGDRNPENMEVAPATSLVHDWATSNYLNRLSSSTAYKPLGIWKLNDPFFVPALITEFNERSVSFDNVIQEKTAVIGNVTDARMRHVIDLGYFGIGFLNGAQLAYRDGIPQNFALDGNRVIINDVTSIRRFNGKNDKAKVETDIFDFVDGIFDLSPSSRVHSMAVDALGSEEYRTELYRHYLYGHSVGAQRSGNENAPLVGLSEFHKIVANVLDKYPAPQK